MPLCALAASTHHSRLANHLVGRDLTKKAIPRQLKPIGSPDVVVLTETASSILISAPREDIDR